MEDPITGEAVEQGGRESDRRTRSGDDREQVFAIAGRLFALLSPSSIAGVVTPPLPMAHGDRWAPAQYGAAPNKPNGLGLFFNFQPKTMTSYDVLNLKILMNCLLILDFFFFHVT